MAYSIRSGRLHVDGPPVTFQRSPNGGADLNPRYLIIHYTAGTSFDGAVSWLTNREAQASAHLVISRTGEIAQLMDFNRVAWHAGRSKWGDLQGLNQHSIGIELVNAGKLHKNGSGAWVNWANNRVPDDQVIIARHKHENSDAGWQNFTMDQINAVVGIGQQLREKYNLLDVLGHDDISPGRKVDPGPAFPMTSVESRIMGRRD